MVSALDSGASGSGSSSATETGISSDLVDHNWPVCRLYLYHLWYKIYMGYLHPFLLSLNDNLLL